ncbi:MAG: hypothetical protein Kapaf2KO_14030 [Candidatus Kapaibacteriales bacterium]
MIDMKNIIFIIVLILSPLIGSSSNKWVSDDIFSDIDGIGIITINNLCSYQNEQIYLIGEYDLDANPFPEDESMFVFQFDNINNVWNRLVDTFNILRFDGFEYVAPIGTDSLLLIGSETSLSVIDRFNPVVDTFNYFGKNKGGWSAYFPDSSFGYTTSGYLHTTNDGGKTWTNLSEKLNQKINSVNSIPAFLHVRFLTDSTFLCIGNGLDWNYDEREFAYVDLRDYSIEIRQTFNFQNLRFSQFHAIDDSIFFLAGERNPRSGGSGNDFILKSTDGGRNWREVLDFYDSFSDVTRIYSNHIAPFGIQEITFRDSLHGIAVGQSSNIL